MKFIDTHNHCYAEDFDSDREEVIKRAVEQGVGLMLMPAIDINSHQRLLSLASSFPGQCLPMMGLHPTSVNEGFKTELKQVKDYLSNRDFHFCAIGEIGVDLYWDRTFEKEQLEAFDLQLDLAIEYNLPVVVHTRNALDTVLQLIESKSNSRLRGIFHCFSGNLSQANHAIKLGFLLGIGGVITYRNPGLQAVVGSITLDNLVLETDAPWLPPVPYRGKRNEPAYIPIIAQKIADIKHITIEAVAQATTDNSIKMFAIDS